MTVTKGYVDTRFGQIHYRVAGTRRADATPVVLLHQTASSSAMFERLMTVLEDSFWMFAPDTPGFGGTDALPQQGSVGLYAEVFQETLRRMEIEQCFLFGHHSGASIAVQMATGCPSLVAKLALSGPPYLTKEQIESLVPSVCPVRLEPDGSHVMAVWNRIRAKDPDAPLELSHRETVLNLHAGVRYPEAYHAVFEHDLPGQLAALQCPTLVMAGAQDTIRKSLEPAYKALKNGTMVAFESGGTYICDREPERVADALKQYFVDKD